MEGSQGLRSIRRKAFIMLQSRQILIENEGQNVFVKAMIKKNHVDMNLSK